MEPRTMIKKTCSILMAAALVIGLCQGLSFAKGRPFKMGAECEGQVMVSMQHSEECCARMREFIESRRAMCAKKAEKPETPRRPECAPPCCPEKPECPPKHCSGKPEMSDEVKAKIDEIKELRSQIREIMAGVRDEVRTASEALHEEIMAKREEICAIRTDYTDQIKAKLEELPDDYRGRCWSRVRRHCCCSKCEPPEIPEDWPDEVKEIFETVKALHEEMENALAAKKAEFRELISQRCSLWKEKKEEVSEEIEALKAQIKQLRDDIKDLMSS